jgi:hypothetical protein
MANGSEAASIARYAEKERPELFCFDFVQSDAMANNVRDLYVTRCT